MAKKGPMPTFKTIDEYIAHQPKDVGDMLSELRSMIREAAPNSTEILNYKIPSFQLIKNGKSDHQVMMAGYKNFISFYPFPTTVEHFAEELNPYKIGKGSVQFPVGKPLPKDLIISMVKFRKEEIENNIDSE